jgi:hypothetical protein
MRSEERGKERIRRCSLRTLRLVAALAFIACLAFEIFIVGLFLKGVISLGSGSDFLRLTVGVAMLMVLLLGLYVGAAFAMVSSSGHGKRE